MALAAQIPFDFFATTTASFDGFVVGDNAEIVSALYALTDTATARPLAGAMALWGAPSVGKSHLLAATAAAISPASDVLLLTAAGAFPDDPFVSARLLCVDDADRLTAAQQAWLFTAFNHIVPSGGAVVVSGHTPPARWSVRDDLRTRLGSGLIFELLAIPQDALPAALAEHAERRGFQLSDEVLTYILSRSRRDIATLWQILQGIDALSLSRKRAVTVPLLREYLAQRALAESNAGPPLALQNQAPD